MMVERLSDLMIAASVMWGHFVDDFKNDESGLSGVVVVVLLVLVSVLAVTLIWGLLSGQLTTWWTNIVNKSNEIQ